MVFLNGEILPQIEPSLLKQVRLKEKSSVLGISEYHYKDETGQVHKGLIQDGTEDSERPYIKIEAQTPESGNVLITTPTEHHRENLGAAVIGWVSVQSELNSDDQSSESSVA